MPGTKMAPKAHGRHILVSYKNADNAWCSADNVWCDLQTLVRELVLDHLRE
jgi:hypothetical protein